MAKQNLAHEFDIAKRRARQLGISLKGLERGVMNGAYLSRPLNLIEFCLHEAAHLVTLGHSPLEFARLRPWRGKSISELLQERFELISTDIADQLEIETARITFIAGQRLELWGADPEPIIASTLKNLSFLGRYSERQTKEVQEAFACLQLAQWSGWVKCDEQASLLVTWFRGSSD